MIAAVHRYPVNVTAYARLKPSAHCSALITKKPDPLHLPGDLAGNPLLTHQSQYPLFISEAMEIIRIFTSFTYACPQNP